MFGTRRLSFGNLNRDRDGDVLSPGTAPWQLRGDVLQAAGGEKPGHTADSPHRLTGRHL